MILGPRVWRITVALTPAPSTRGAPIVTFLCSDMASYITGNSINIDGGLIKSLF